MNVLVCDIRVFCRGSRWHQTSSENLISPLTKMLTACCHAFISGLFNCLGKGNTSCVHPCVILRRASSYNSNNWYECENWFGFCSERSQPCMCDALKQPRLEVNSTLHVATSKKPSGSKCLCGHSMQDCSSSPLIHGRWQQWRWRPLPFSPYGTKSRRQPWQIIHTRHLHHLGVRAFPQRPPLSSCGCFTAEQPACSHTVCGRPRRCVQSEKLIFLVVVDRQQWILKILNMIRRLDI